MFLTRLEPKHILCKFQKKEKRCMTKDVVFSHALDLVDAFESRVDVKRHDIVDDLISIIEYLARENTALRKVCKEVINSE